MIKNFGKGKKLLEISIKKVFVIKDVSKKLFLMKDFYQYHVYDDKSIREENSEVISLIVV